LVRKPEGKRQFERWDNFKMGLREIGLEGVDWIHLAQSRDRWWTLVDTVMKLPVL
jgi:hypothetical protein